MVNTLLCEWEKMLRKFDCIPVGTYVDTKKKAGRFLHVFRCKRIDKGLVLWSFTYFIGMKAQPYFNKI